MKNIKSLYFATLLVLVCAGILFMRCNMHLHDVGEIVAMESGQSSASIGQQSEEVLTSQVGIENMRKLQEDSSTSSHVTNTAQISPHVGRASGVLKQSNAIPFPPSETMPAKDVQNISPRKNPSEEERLENEKTFVRTARSALDEKNVPVGERTAVIDIQRNEVIVVYSPKPGERAGDFIVRIDRNTGEVLDTKIWR